jgi:hypothetical protein
MNAPEVVHWSDPRVRKLAGKHRREAYDLANKLDDLGADVGRLLLDHHPGGSEVVLSAIDADKILAALLWIPRSKRGRPPKLSTRLVKQLVHQRGFSKRQAARQVSRLSSSGETPEQLRRRAR